MSILGPPRPTYRSTCRLILGLVSIDMSVTFWPICRPSVGPCIDRDSVDMSTEYRLLCISAAMSTNMSPDISVDIAIDMSTDIGCYFDRYVGQ